MGEHLERIGSELLASARQLLEKEGIPVSEAGTCQPIGEWLYPLAIMGFGSETLRGSVSFEIPWPVLRASHPTKSESREDLADWVGELANLVLGAFKRRLHAHGITIQLGLPLTLTTGDTRAGRMAAPQLQFQVKTGEGTVVIRLSAEITGDLAFLTPAREDTIGDVELF
jgi:nucleotide-binding universal stress UspA family protein